MIKPLSIAPWLRCSCAALLMSCTVVATAPLYAQERTSGARAARSNPAVATDGATLIHGNYCGAGNRPGKPPIDALDLACMNHDACTPASGIPNCDCNARLRDEAAAVAGDPRQAPELQSLAALTSAAAAVMICKPMIDAAVPPVAAPVPVARDAPAAGAPVAIAPAPVAGAPVSIVPDSVAPVAAAPVTDVTETPLPVAPVTDAPAPALPVPRSTALP
jgi:hypothetical protein